MKKILVFFSLALALSLAGCKDGSKTSGVNPSGESSKSSGGAMHKDLFNFAIDSLNRLEQFQTGAVQGEINLKLFELEKNAASPATARESTLLAAWPESESLRQIVDRLNRWIRAQTPARWQLDPMLAELPEPLKNLPLATGAEKLEIGPFDGFYLQEAVYLRDVALAARGKSIDDLSRAKCLFDWTIRNIQLDANSPDRVPQFPWETLFFGHGTAEERAWTYVLLLRQQGLEAAVLAVERGDDLKPWCVAVRIGGKAYLFDLQYGLPIPGPAGFQKGPQGQLDLVPAALDQLAAEESLLARMTADAEHPYAVAAADLKNVVALVEASPAALSKRMKTIESHLQGKQKMVLTASASEQAEHWKSTPGVSAAKLWRLPYETIRRRSELKPAEIAQLLSGFLPFYAMPADLLHRDDIMNKARRTPRELQDIYKGSAAEKNGKTPQNPNDSMQDTESQKMRRQIAEWTKFSTTFAAPLYKGRVLQLKGQTGGEAGAMACYQMARPSQAQLQKLQVKLLGEFVRANLPEKNMEPEEREKLVGEIVDAIVAEKPLDDAKLDAFARRIGEQSIFFIRSQAALILAGKLDASYWLGLATYERADYPTAADYFYMRTLSAWPDGPWTHGARYNFGRTAEAMGEIDEAAKLYRSGTEAPDAAGQLLRAKWLQESNEKKEEKAAEETK